MLDLNPYLGKIQTGFVVNVSSSTDLGLKKLDSAELLDSAERQMLKDLINNGCRYIVCYYNDDGHVESLVVDKLGKKLDSLYLPYLEYLRIFAKSVEDDVVIQRHPSLRILVLRKQGLTKIPHLLNLVNLERLLLDGNKFASLKGFEKLEGCEKLQEIDLSSNFISDLCDIEVISHIPKLSTIRFNNNKITDLNITANVPNLINLHLRENHIERITAVKNLSNLNRLDISNNNLHELPLENFENLPNLWTLDLSYNNLLKLSLKNFENLPRLSSIDVKENPLKSISGLEKFSDNNLKIENLNSEYFYGSVLETFESYLHSIGYIFSDDGSIYKPPPPEAEFQISKRLTLRLEYGEINLYVDDELFDRCVVCLLTIPKGEIHKSDRIFNSIDEIDEIFNSSQIIDGNEILIVDIPKKTQFWGHASNLQAWVENDYDTRLLHKNIAFSLLRKLTEIGDPIAKKVFKEEIARRYASGHDTVRKFLKLGGYLKYLSKEELSSIS